MEFAASSEQIDFQSRRDDPRGTTPAMSRIRYRPMDGIVRQPAPGTIEHFLMERYILYTIDDEHRLRRARVHHQPYPIQRADLLHFQAPMIPAAGIRRPEAAPLRQYGSQASAKV